jgi:hypothetical protein
MSKEKKSQRAPLEGSQIVSAVSTGGGGGVFQARVGALYLANMLTGLPTVFGLHSARVETLRFEARYTGAHTDDIYCQLRDEEGTRRQLIQCKRGLDARPSNKDFVDGLQGAWRDFLGVEGSPFDRVSDILVLATVAPATPANLAAKRLCETSRSSLDLTDFVQKVESGVFDIQHRRTWNAFKEISKNTLSDKYTEELVFDLLRRLRVDIHDLGNEVSQELSLVQALLNSDQPGDSGEQVWNGLFSYVFEQGITVSTITQETWKATAQAGIQEAVSRLTGQKRLGNIAQSFNDLASHQLSLISTRLPNGAHIPRGQCAAQVLAGFDERQLVIVTGGPGVGKSAVIAELAPLLRESGPLFFFKAEELDEPSLAAVKSLGNMPDAVQGMNRFLRNGTPTVIIDSLEKAVEVQNQGALEELLVLVRRNKNVKLCVTTRSYALNALCTLFLSEFSYQVVEVPLLTDTEIATAVAGTNLENITAKDTDVREVLRAPYYLRLAVNYTATGEELPQTGGNDLRLFLWMERVAPSKRLAAGLAARRRITFDEICYARTERFAQFVVAPNDAEAVASLLQDAVLVKDATDRVSPTHDVLEDWSLFFRVEREMRGIERDWSALFFKLGSHAGMRRALRTWTAERSAKEDADAYALLKAALQQDATVPQLWRDEVVIGLLRSEGVEELFQKLSSDIAFNSASLLKRMSHLLRVACKGPTSIDYSSLADNPENKEMILRLAMAAPVGKAWDVIIRLVANAFPTMPSECNSWVVQLAEDAISHDDNWYKPSQRVLDVFNMAEHFCSRDQDYWYREQSVGKRFYALLCSSSGADPNRFQILIEQYLLHLQSTPEDRNSYVVERLEFLVNVKNCRETSFFTPDLVWKVFNALYIDNKPEKDKYFGDSGWERELGLKSRVAHEFFPPSVLQGPFRALLAQDFLKSVRRIVELCNHAANSFAKTSTNEVSIISVGQSPTGEPHIHSSRLWVTYRGHSVSSYLLNSALMALEERLLIEAKTRPEIISQVLEFIVDAGTSSFTTGMVAGVLMAHPELVNKKLLNIFKCPQFFSSDIARSVQESSALAIHGGHDGLDTSRQQERTTSNRLSHRREHLEDLCLKLQFDRPDLREDIYQILDIHLAALGETGEASVDWRIALKRMDARGLRLGKPIGNSNWVTLEIAELAPELAKASNEAQDWMQIMNQMSKIEIWAAAVTERFTTAEAGTSERYLSSAEPYTEFLQLDEKLKTDEFSIFAGLDEKLACALICKWPADNSEALQWARSLVLERASVIEDKDAWLMRQPALGALRARTVISLAAFNPNLSNMVEALVNIVTEPMWEMRRATARAISEVLRHKQPVLAEVLTTGLAQYAEQLAGDIERPQRRNRDFVDEARSNTISILSVALREMKPGKRPSPNSLAAIKEWTIVLEAARSETPDAWRVQSLMTLTQLVASQEARPRVQRSDPEHIDFEARWELGDLLAGELTAQFNDSSSLFGTFDYCLENAPELSERILESALDDYLKREFTNNIAFWRIWDRATAKIFKENSLRNKSKSSYSRFDKVLTTLLLCSKPWPKTWHDLQLFSSRPYFIANCLAEVGDSRKGLENLLWLMAGIGRTSAVPSALTNLRDALERSPADLFDDGNSLWHAETICRVAVHEHREILIRDVKLRRVTLAILDRLVDAGSSLAFQLRDYLATSPAAFAEQIA